MSSNREARGGRAALRGNSCKGHSRQEEPQMHRAAIALLAALTCGAALAQGWPAKSVRVVVPSPPGGGADTVSRILFPHVAETLGQPFVIENRGGGGGTIGPA